jgi:hypothetical protein
MLRIVRTPAAVGCRKYGVSIATDHSPAFVQIIGMLGQNNADGLHYRKSTFAWIGPPSDPYYRAVRIARRYHAEA